MAEKEKNFLQSVQQVVQAYDFDKVVKRWLAEHREVLPQDEDLSEENTHWCQWLEEKRPDLVKKFAKALGDEEEEIVSAPTLEGKWEKWINDQMGFLVEE